MNIWFSDYVLQPRYSLNAKLASRDVRGGRLLKVEFAPGKIGYSDLSQPQFLENSLNLAKLDSEYRARGKSAFAHLRLPKTHKIITEIETHGKGESLLNDKTDSIQLYSHYKIKMGRDLSAETKTLYQLIKSLPQEKKIRLDFNAVLPETEFSEWWKNVSEWLVVHLDFIEDPFPFDPNRWGAWLAQCPLALDADLNAVTLKNPSAQVVIVKPAWFDIGDCKVDSRVVFTNGMDHPLGQMAALYKAAKYYEKYPEKEEVGGLRSWELFETTEFSEYLGPQVGGEVKPAHGTGFGFDEILERVNWMPMQ